MTSVIIPTYNRSQLLLRVLSALRAQTLGCWAFEVVVVDDGSSDDTPARVTEYRDSASVPEIEYSQQENRGPAAARNADLAAAKAPA